MLSSSHWASSIAIRTGRSAGESSQQPGDRDGQGALVRRLGAGLDPQQRDPERLALRPGQLRERLVVDVAEEVGQPAEREPLLRRAPAGRTG